MNDEGCMEAPMRPQVNREVVDGMMARPGNQTAGLEAPPDVNRNPALARPITIEARNHGFLVTVGCQSFAIEKVSTLIRNIDKYLERPTEVEKKWMDGKLEL